MLGMITMFCFLFKHKTAYDMRISDWSSDVCSSDLALGTVKRLSVAVALRNPETGEPRSAKEIAALEQLIKGAVGYDQGRGDVVAVSARKFVAADAVGLGEKWYEASWVSMLARNLSALLVALVLVFGIGRPDRKSTRLNSS